MTAVIQVCVIALLISVGFFLAKKKIFTRKTGQSLSYLLVNFVTPALILQSFQLDYTPDKLHGLLTAALLVLISYVVVIAFSFLLFGKTKEHRIERLAVTFSNVGFMGLPLVSGIYGAEGVFYASIAVIGFNVVFWTFGITVLRGKLSRENVKKILLSPTLIAVAAGLILFLFRIRLPDPFASVVHHLANLNTPIAMIVAGISISESHPSSALKNVQLYKVLAGKLLLVPLLLAGVFAMIPAPRLIKQVLVLQQACPPAVLISTVLLQCGKDDRKATEYFVITTIVSMVTIPLVHFLSGLIL